MSETKVLRQGFGEDGIYLDAARNRYLGAISLGYGPDGKRFRRKVSAKTKHEVRKRRVALSRTGLAVRVDMAQPALSCLEAGGGVPTVSLLERISAALDAGLGLQLADGRRDVTGQDGRVRPPRFGERSRCYVLGPRVQRRRDRVVRICHHSPGVGKDLVGPADLPRDQRCGMTGGAAPCRAGRAGASWLRELMPSLGKTFRRW
jgi:transcriptional regulator with XRE-family HTH domain